MVVDYVMLKPTPKARRHMQQLRVAHRLDESYHPSRFHVTIRRLGDRLTDAQLGALCTVFAGVDMAPFDIVFDTLAGNLLRGRKGIGGPMALHRLLTRRIERSGFVLPEHRFWLHASLAYRGEAVGPADPGRTITPFGWRAEEFLLVRSVHGEGHELLGRWPLAPRQGDLFH